MSLKTIVNTLLTISPSFIAIIIGVLRFKYLRSQYLLLFIFVAFALFTEISLRLTVSVFGIETTPGAHFYVMIEFLLLSLFYLKMLKGSINKTVFWIIVLLFELYCIANILFIQGLNVYPNFVRAIGALIILIFSFLFFAKIMIEAKIEKLVNEPMIWINIAFIIYFAADFFFNILFNDILEYSRTFLRQIANFTLFINVLQYCLIAVGFWKTKKAGQEVKKQNIVKV